MARCEPGDVNWQNNEDTARMPTALVKSREYEVRAEYTGPNRLRVAEGYRPELIVSDIGLPGIDGYSIAREPSYALSAPSWA